MKSQKISVGQSLAGFSVDRVEGISEIRSEAAVFTHLKTGARVLHLFNEDPDNLFCISFRTPVFNNTGVPHILEHSVLAGSKKFPLKDPFKEMLKGSLHTFLNAVTYPDKTVYPVSSQVEKDFFNLVDIYCDAVFNPLLTEMTFYQEGWHFDLENRNDPVSIKGIVYNEMKGVFSDFRSHVARKTLSELFPDTTYFFESGGVPEEITDLTYEQFKAFHAAYYHPSNSFTVLYGSIPSEKSLTFLHDRYLAAFDRRQVDSIIKPQPQWSQARRVQFPAPAPAEDDGTASVIVSWLFGSSCEPETVLLGKIFSHYFFDNEGSPLRRALVDSGLGEDLDDMCGYDSDLIQGLFCAGLRKTKPEHADMIRDLIFETLRQEAWRGLDEELLEGSIRQIEFQLREITDGGHFPYNIKLAERVLRSWLYGGDPLAHLKFEKPLIRIKEKKKEGTVFFVDAVRRLLIDNTHNLLSIIVASSRMGEQLGKKTEEQASLLAGSFTEHDRERYHAVTRQLLEEQKQAPSPEALATLPKLNKDDLPPEQEKVPVVMTAVDGVTVYTHPLFTAGIVYCDVGFDCTGIPFSLLPYFPLYSELLTRCGTAGYTSEEMSKRISLHTGGISCSDICTPLFGTSDDLVFKSFFHGKVLPERFDALCAIFHDLFVSPQLDNEKLLRDILFEMRNELNGSVVRSGHHFAVANAASRLVKSQYIEEILDGVAQLRFLDGLVKKKEMKTVVDMMHKLHEVIISRNHCFFSLTTEDPDRYLTSLGSLLARLPDRSAADAGLLFQPDDSAKPLGIEISSSVNYVGRSWSLGSWSPEIMGRYYLLSRNLSTGFLWDKVRVEGGAYGGMALVSSSQPVFSCASYRDPNISRTLENFDAGLQTVAAGVPADEVEQNIIGTIGRIDQPRSPHSKGFGETVALITGRSVVVRQQIRDAVLQCTGKDLSRCARQLLDTRETAVTVFGSAKAFDDAEHDGVAMAREPLLENGK